MLWCRKFVSLRYFFIACFLVLGCRLEASARRHHRDIEFLVFIPSYNNENFCVKNLESVFSQTYPFWTIYYVNDCSTDRTGAKVEEYIRQRSMQHKCTVVHNASRCRAMANYYMSLKKCPSHKVVVSLDGDDYLANPQVLEKLAAVYKNPKVWITYGSYANAATGARGHCVPLPPDIIKERKFRQYPWVTSQLRTFYAALFQKVKKKHLKMNHDFVPAACDLAMMFPMLEMASRGHIRYVDDILYMYNVTPLSDCVQNYNTQAAVDAYVRSLKPYKPLSKLFKN